MRSITKDLRSSGRRRARVSPSRGSDEVRVVDHVVSDRRNRVAVGDRVLDLVQCGIGAEVLADPWGRWSCSRRQGCGGGARCTTPRACEVAVDTSLIARAIGEVDLDRARRRHLTVKKRPSTVQVVWVKELMNSQKLITRTA